MRGDEPDESREATSVAVGLSAPGPGGGVDAGPADVELELESSDPTREEGVDSSTGAATESDEEEDVGAGAGAGAGVENPVSSIKTTPSSERLVWSLPNDPNVAPERTIDSLDTATIALMLSDVLVPS